MYVDLPRTSNAPSSGLWLHQGDVIREFMTQVEAPDLALQLPTGTGKTLTGLLITEWTRRSRRNRVIYACPTQQLAKQVYASAVAEGIRPVLLIGKSQLWSTPDQARYEAGEAVAITTYSSIFNTNPKLAAADQILFDDAHAGEQYVGEKYGVTIDRRTNREEYFALLVAIQSGLDGVYLDRLREAVPDPTISEAVRLVVPLRQDGMADRVSVALGGFSGDLSFQYAMIRGVLQSCLIYVSYRGILIRPYIPPTEQNSLFAGARQRLYVSATLGDGGELERAFGRRGIVRLTAAVDKSSLLSGRRFFIFPELAATNAPASLGKDIVKRAGKALILAPSRMRAEAAADELGADGWPRFTIDDVSNGMAPFAEAKHAVCGLASRYDGLDLPGDSCRCVVIDQIPDQDSLQERFLSGRARASIAFSERVQARVIQGTGRATRGPRDLAVVLVYGPELARYLSRPETTASMDPNLQAEIKFGRENSQDVEPSEILANVQAFLGRAPEWLLEAEPAIAKVRDGSPRRVSAASRALQTSVSEEVLAWADAGVGRWKSAATHAQQAAHLIGDGEPETNGYQAFWLYLAAQWTDQAASDTADTALHASAVSLVERAEGVAGFGTWLREMPALPMQQEPVLAPEDAVAIDSITARLEVRTNLSSVPRELGEMMAGLQAKQAEVYEPALLALGEFLGADATKPKSSARPDCVWAWKNHAWLILEAKSEHSSTGVVSVQDVRQANTQRDLVVKDRAVPRPPAQSATVIISPRATVHHDGVTIANRHLYLTNPGEVVLKIGFDIEAAWTDLMRNSVGLPWREMRGQVRDALSTRMVLPSQVFERLTRDPINP
ncbi:DEAD/DEAH box helicase [Rathayibacter sp. VKM Ac-2835]|uniref:DEAD/DEAH box helicase n=1 Tax=Rathayibacter sp. VKM Ac-2835 TaxID=2739043 RepID=UPI00265E0A56|nr:DEAD/DEAH box helicase [Rathayibacter sp. VKM Ac-2835]